MTTNAPQDEWRQYWAEMEAGCRRIVHYTRDMDEATFYRDERTFDAVLRNLELIHDAAQSLPDDIHPRLAEDDWRTLASFKEITTNARFGRNPMGLWTVVDEQIPALLQTLRAVHKEATEVKRDPRLRRRGRNAAKPWELPPLGWRDIGWRVWNELFKDNVFIVSAGVAFYVLLAIVPALAALVSIYGLLADPADVESQFAVLGEMLPPQAWEVLRSQLREITARPQAVLGFGAFTGLLVALWSARIGVAALMQALNIVYNEDEKRSIIRFYLTSLLLTVGAVLFSVIALAMIVALPVLLGPIGLDMLAELLIRVLRWPFLAAIIILALAVLYRIGPSRNAARWEWVSVGAVVATVLWILGSILFSFYVSRFGGFNQIYGSMGAVIILMLWFWLTAFVILLGAELNAEMEHQTRRDTTVGKPKPMGQRNAYMADTLGRRP